MGGKIIIFVGIIILGTSALIYANMDNATIKVNGRITNDPETRTNLKLYLCGGLSALGALFVFGGLRSVIRLRKRMQRSQYILQNGTEATGTVTFVDKNYSILINNNPIYSIIEYQYNDTSGTLFTQRMEFVSSEIVIRQQIQVGSTVRVKYAPENPVESVLQL